MSQGQGIDLRMTTAITCEACGNHTFTPGYFLRRLSGLVSPDGNDQVVPVDTLMCSKCGHVNDDYNTHKKLQEEENKS